MLRHVKQTHGPDAMKSLLFPCPSCENVHSKTPKELLRHMIDRHGWHYSRPTKTTHPPRPYDCQERCNAWLEEVNKAMKKKETEQDSDGEPAGPVTEHMPELQDF